METRIILMNGFDRSGSSMISRMLCKHKDIELIFQPFNGTNVRKRMYEIWDNSIATPEDSLFFERLNEGRFIETYVKSGWYEKFSTTRSIIPGKVHIIKTTLNHLMIDWIRENYPGIDIWGIWRDPVSILRSIYENGFFYKWYRDEAVEELSKTVAANDELNEVFGKWAYNVHTEKEKIAFLISVRSYFFFRRIDNDHVLRYEAIIQNEDKNAELNRFLHFYGLDEMDFSSFIKTDYNITGKPLGELKGKEITLNSSIAEMFGILEKLSIKQS